MIGRRRTTDCDGHKTDLSRSVEPVDRQQAGGDGGRLNAAATGRRCGGFRDSADVGPWRRLTECAAAGRKNKRTTACPSCANAAPEKLKARLLYSVRLKHVYTDARATVAHCKGNFIYVQNNMSDDFVCPFDFRPTSAYFGQWLNTFQILGG